MGSAFTLGLVVGFVWAGQNDSRVIVTGHIPICAIDGWILRTGLGDVCLELVRDQLRRHAHAARKGPHVARYPVRQALRPTGLNIGAIGCTQRRDKDLCCTYLARFRTDNIHGMARLVDKLALPSGKSTVAQPY